MAARPKTLPAAAAPVIVGAAVAWHAGAFQPAPALAALLAALLLQIGANYANDVYDFKKGADTHTRLGPTRVTQAGLLTPAQVIIWMWVWFGLAALLGVYLILVAGWPILLIGVCSIAAAIAYTAGPYPLGYNGLGEVFVFIFFGLAAVGGTEYVQALRLSPLGLWCAIPMGLLASAILCVNNLRDLETDRATGKRTLAVFFGERGAQVEYSAILAIAYLLPVAIWISGQASAWVLLSWLTLPMAVRLVKMMYTQRGTVLNRALAGTGQLELFFGLLLSLGLILGR